MAQDVGQRLLHDAIGGGADRRGHALLGAVEVDVDAHPGRAQRRGELGHPGQHARRLHGRGGVLVAQQAEGGAQVVERRARDALDLGQRGLGLARALVQDVGGDAGLDVDGDHRVGHDVVDLPGDAQALVGEAALGLVAGAALALGLALRPRPARCAATAHRVAEDQGDEEDAEAGQGVVAEQARDRRTGS